MDLNHSRHAHYTHSFESSAESPTAPQQHEHPGSEHLNWCGRVGGRDFVDRTLSKNHGESIKYETNQPTLYPYEKKRFHTHEITAYDIMQLGMKSHDAKS